MGNERPHYPLRRPYARDVPLAGAGEVMLSTRAIVCTFHLLKLHREHPERAAALQPLPDEDELSWMCRVRDWAAEKSYYYTVEIET